MKNRKFNRQRRQRKMAMPELVGPEREKAEERTALRAAVVHEAIRLEGDAELKRPLSALTWSSLAAGLSMGLSMLSKGLLQMYLPDVSWRPILSNFGYTIGFLVVVLGRQQLFTENTVTVIIPLLAHRDSSTLWKVIRLWVIVLAGNVVGALGFAIIASHSGIFPPQLLAAFSVLGKGEIAGSFGRIFMKAVFAGWLIAAMVWMLPANESGIAIVIIMTYIVGLGHFQHVIVGSTEVLFLIVSGHLFWSGYFSYFVPTLLGNIFGGVLLVALFNHAQVATDTPSG